MGKFCRAKTLKLDLHKISDVMKMCTSFCFLKAKRYLIKPRQACAAAYLWSSLPFLPAIHGRHPTVVWRFSAISVILLLCFSSFEIKWKKHAFVTVDPSITPSSPVSDVDSEQGGWCMPNVKEFRIRVSLPSSYTRLQLRVFAKALIYTFVLAGPGFLLAPPLLLVERFVGASKLVKGWLSFLLNLRSLWNLVQITYASAGLCAGSCYFLVRDSDRFWAQTLRGGLEEMWL